jgi:hypothetical protein
MSKPVRSLPAILLVMLIAGCTSYQIKSECERTDWYKYGQSAALAGRRLSGDHKIKQCEDVDAKVDDVALDHGFKEGMSAYCEPEMVLQNGKRGDFFNDDMCEHTVRLQREHQAGVRMYCSKANGFAAGAIGKTYNGICPKDLEAAFVSQFNRGRKNFLSATIASNESALSDLEVAVGRLQGERFMNESQLNSLSPEVVPQTVVVVDPMSGQQTVQTTATDSAINARRFGLESQLSSIDLEIFEKRRQAEKLRAANRDLRVQMTLL